MKGKHVGLLIVLILIADQALKFYIKTHYLLGEEHNIIGSWFRLHFVENEGMAWGLKFGGGAGKILLTLFRLVAVIFGTFYLRSIVQKKYHTGFIVCAALIYSGAFGNLIDSMFYGLIFDRGGIHFEPALNNYIGYQGVAKLGGSYASFLHGSVVDMLYFPIIDTHYPSWFPIKSWRGDEFEFFSPVFNLADSSISIGVIALLIWQKKFFPDKHIKPVKPSPEISDKVRMV